MTNCRQLLISQRMIHALEFSKANFKFQAVFSLASGQRGTLFYCTSIAVCSVNTEG